MDAIVAVYDDWGIGCEGDQPIALRADRKFFRRTTANSTVIVGRKTVGSFPGQQPLPKRRNILLSRQDITIPGFETAHSPEEAMELSNNDERVFVIGGGTVYRQMLPQCCRAVITKVHTTAPCDTWFPNLDEDEAWDVAEVSEPHDHEGLIFRYVTYKRK